MYTCLCIVQYQYCLYICRFFSKSIPITQAAKMGLGFLKEDLQIGYVVTCSVSPLAKYRWAFFSSISVPTIYVKQRKISRSGTLVYLFFPLSLSTMVGMCRFGPVSPPTLREDIAKATDWRQVGIDAQ